MAGVVVCVALVRVATELARLTIRTLREPLSPEDHGLLDAAAGVERSPDDGVTSAQPERTEFALPHSDSALPRPMHGVAGKRGASANAGGPKVLIILFESSIRLLCRVQFEHEGMEVIEAEDGATGLEKARTEAPDIIVLDVNLPRTVQRTRRLGREKLHYPGWPDGWSVAEQLHENPATREIPFIFLTPRAEFNDRRRGLELGAVDYVTQPFNPLELPGLVQNVLDRRARNELDDLRQEKAAELRLMTEDDTTTT